MPNRNVSQLADLSVITWPEELYAAATMSGAHMIVWACYLARNMLSETN
jgi:hypothetical protein